MSVPEAKEGKPVHFVDLTDPTKYLDMRDRVHLDEKWFFLTWEKERYLLLPEEKEPTCCVKHKSHTTKVMFLCAVTIPCFTPFANCWWDGKFGIWPIGEWKQVKQKLKNRPKGTLVWKSKTMTQQVYQGLLISK